MNFKRYFTLPLFFFALAAGSNLKAQISQFSDILVGADEMVRDSQTNRLDLNGNVQVIFEEKHLFAQKATVDLKTKKIIASGKVSILTPATSTDGDRVELNYGTGNGIIYNGFVQAGNVTFSGDVIRKVGSNEYEIENGVYTACKTCPPAWSFSGYKIKAELGGYAYIQQPIFRLASYPFFWLPYLVVPLKSKRQSGFLFPSFSNSPSGGFALEGRFFWAIDEHKDMTIKLKNYSKRGFKPLINYRFFADIDSYGEFSGAFIKDKVFPSSSRISSDLQSKESIDRWYIKYDQYFTLPGGLIQRTKLNLMSDLQYFIDFPEESNISSLRGDPALENRISLTKNTQDWHASAEAAVYINQLKSDVKENNDDAVHRLPDLQFSMAETKLAETNVTARFDLNYTNFARNNFSFDDITFDSTGEVPKRFNATRDGEFNFDGTTTQDQIRTGQRLDIKPQFAYAFNLGPYLEVLPKATFRYTRYDFGIGNSPSTDRAYARTEVSARTFFEKVYSPKDSFNKYKHDVIPQISFTHTPLTHQPDHPFFGNGSELFNFRSDLPVTDDDFYSDAGLQFDYNDRIVDQKLARFSLTQKLTKKAIDPDTEELPTYSQIALFRISQSYDFIEAQETVNPEPWSDIEALFDLRLSTFSTNTVINYFPYDRVSNISSRLRFNFYEANFIQLTYNIAYSIDSNRDVDLSSRNENIFGQVGWIAKYFNFLANTNFSATTNKLLSWGYNLQLKPPGECWGLNFNFNQPIGGEGNFSFNFAYSFDGKTPTVVSSNSAFLN